MSNSGNRARSDDHVFPFNPSTIPRSTAPSHAPSQTSIALLPPPLPALPAGFTRCDATVKFPSGYCAHGTCAAPIDSAAEQVAHHNDAHSRHRAEVDGPEEAGWGLYYPGTAFCQSCQMMVLIDKDMVAIHAPECQAHSELLASRTYKLPKGLYMRIGTAALLNGDASGGVTSACFYNAASGPAGVPAAELYKGTMAVLQQMADDPVNPPPGMPRAWAESGLDWKLYLSRTVGSPNADTGQMGIVGRLLGRPIHVVFDDRATQIIEGLLSGEPISVWHNGRDFNNAGAHFETLVPVGARAAGHTGQGPPPPPPGTGPPPPPGSGKRARSPNTPGGRGAARPAAQAPQPPPPGTGASAPAPGASASVPANKRATSVPKVPRTTSAPALLHKAVQPRLPYAPRKPPPSPREIGRAAVELALLPAHAYKRQGIVP